MKIDFPLLNISEKEWKREDLETDLVLDQYIYTDNQEIFDKYWKRKLYCDCLRNECFLCYSQSSA